ncbi:hypothetical protein F5884DRAFT_778396 [Xylogone sp. PMI_703]|nr:hypothetical protein F5884DRAFT_778396 [Xylogone sp. PMI_703]
MLSQNASQACWPCKKLKRKCTRELPICSLCLRLGKSCDYPIQALEPRPQKKSPPQNVDIQNDTPNCKPLRRSPGSTIGFPDIKRAILPAKYFLDSTSRRQINADRPDPSIPIPEQILDILQPDILYSLCDTFLQSTYTWLPILSPKRLFHKVNNFSADPDIGLALLLACMKLVSEPQSEQPVESALYGIIKEFYCTVENSSLPSLQLLQSTVFLAAYELGNGIYPQAYMTTGHAARMGIMMGLHDKERGTQLFKEAKTWSQCEEERRTWWAVIILDRYVNLGVRGFPLATPLPLQGALLPCPESSWNNGEVGINEPLFVSSFTTNTEIGSFACVCQASHVLGLVLRHRDDNSHIIEPQFRLLEALQLHQTLVALNSHLTIHNSACGYSTRNESTEVAIALCCSARLILYGMYACNDHDSGRPRIPEETEMQRISMQGLKEVMVGAYQLAKDIYNNIIAGEFNTLLSRSPMLCHCLCDAASECAWFIQEGDGAEGVEHMKMMVEMLRTIEDRWKIAGDYLATLEEEGALAATQG